MKRGIKKCAVLLLALVMTFETLPMKADAEEVLEVEKDAQTPIAVASGVITGTIGPNNGIIYSYNSTTKTLTVSGSENSFAGKYQGANGGGFVSPFAEISTDIETIIMQNCTLNGIMSYMFANQKNLKTVTFENVNTSNVTSMTGLFYGCESLTSLDLSGLNTANVQDMSDMFYMCTALTNLDVSGFSTEQVVDMKRMFLNCLSISNLNLSSFDTSNVTDMSSMFYGCTSLQNLDISSFDTSKARTFSLMFMNCAGLRELDLSHFNTENVRDMQSMFRGCTALESIDVSGFHTLKLTELSNLFYDCESLVDLNLSSFTTLNVERYTAMFSGCSALQRLDISGFDTAKGTDFSNMFRNCSSLTSLNLSHFDTANVTSMMSMFEGCSGLESLNISNFDTDKVASMMSMFKGCSALESLNISSFNTSNLNSMDSMFANCEKLSSLDLSNFNTSNVVNMNDMFFKCFALKKIDLSSFDTSKVVTMERFMYCCKSLERLELSNFDLSALQQGGSFLTGCDSLNVIYTPKALAAGKKFALPDSFQAETGDMISEITGEYCDKVLMRNIPATRAITLSVPKAATKITINNNMQFTLDIAGETAPLAACREFNWTVSDPNVLSVSDKGVVTGVGMGTATVTCTGKFNAAETASYQFTIEMPFTDIKATDWQYPYVLYAYQNDLMGGKGEGKFDMNGNITRGEFVTVLYSNANKPAVTYEDCFTDVPEGKWFADAVIWAKQNNVTAGNPDGSFGVFTNITREQLVVMLYQYAKSNGINPDGVTEDLSSFADAPKVSSWAAEAMKWGVQNSIIGGKNKTDGTYLDPQGKTARGECATMMMRYVELAKE